MAKKPRRIPTFGSMDVLPSGRVRARYSAPDGRRYARTFPDESAARAWLTAAEADIAYDRWVPPTSEHAARVAAQRDADRAMTVAEWAERWLDAGSVRWAPRTGLDHRSRLRKHFLPDLGQTLLIDVTRGDVDEWHRKLRRRASAGVPRPVFMTVRALFRAAVEEGIISESPVRVRGADRHQPVRDPERDRVLDAGAVERIAAAMPDHLRLAVWLGARCGLRIGEVLALRRHDIVVEDRVIQVRRQVVAITDGRGAPLRETPPKSRASIRAIPIPASIAETLAAHLDEHAAGGARGLLFPRPGTRGRGLLHPNTLRATFARAVAGSERVGVVFHDLRHTCLTRLARAGATTADLMAFAGHSDAEVAQRYQHASLARTGQLAAEADRLDAAG